MANRKPRATRNTATRKNQSLYMALQHAVRKHPVQNLATEQAIYDTLTELNELNKTNQDPTAFIATMYEQLDKLLSHHARGYTASLNKRREHERAVLDATAHEHHLLGQVGLLEDEILALETRLKNKNHSF